MKRRISSERLSDNRCKHLQTTEQQLCRGEFYPSYRLTLVKFFDKAALIDFTQQTVVDK